jgi:hypothetical protein
VTPPPALDPPALDPPEVLPIRSRTAAIEYLLTHAAEGHASMISTAEAITLLVDSDPDDRAEAAAAALLRALVLGKPVPVPDIIRALRALGDVDDDELTQLGIAPGTPSGTTPTACAAGPGSTTAPGRSRA